MGVQSIQMDRPSAPIRYQGGRDGYPVCDVDPFSDAFFEDPYPAHAVIRDAGPVVWIERYGVWAMARHKEVAATLNDWATFISGAGAGIQDLRNGKAWRPPSVVLESDPPLHDTTRGAISRVITGPAIRGLRDAFKREADRLVDALIERQTFDGVADFAAPYPLKVVGDAVGVPDQGRECLLPFGDMLFNSFGPDNDIFRRSIIRAAGVTEQIYAQCDRAALTPDSFGAKIYQAADAGLLPAEYAPALVRSILSAGFDTTVNGLGNALYAFARHPDEWDRFRNTPALHRTFFDEVIRWETPAQTFFRTASRDVEIDGIEIARDEKVLLFLGAANRDPRKWTDPDRFMLERNPAGHLAFGAGIHVCVGQIMARLEAELLFAAFAERVARFELCEPPVLRINNTLRGFSRLPIRVHLD
jgi:4-methoxybenzoate monooxygenase (O-demethylating)